MNSNRKPAPGTMILVASFGTSYKENLDLTIGAIEKAIAEAYPACEVRRAFTSRTIIRKLGEQNGLEIDDMEQALERALKDGIRNLIVQPTHLMKGHEYMDLADTLKKYEGRFARMVLGEPLLSDEADLDAVVNIITEKTAIYNDGETAVCFMGHGTDAAANSVYTKLQEKLQRAGHKNYYIGTVEADPALKDILSMLKSSSPYKKAVLEPLMVVAGDHANNDMAGNQEDSWKSVLERAGYKVECLMEGLGQLPAIRELYAAHVQAAADRFCEQGN